MQHQQDSVSEAFIVYEHAWFRASQKKGITISQPKLAIRALVLLFLERPGIRCFSRSARQDSIPRQKGVPNL